MQTYYLKTFGCSMNYSDSERISYVLDKAGLQETAEMKEADLVVFNTCAIKQKAEDKAFSLVNNVHKNRRKQGKAVKILRDRLYD